MTIDSQQVPQFPYVVGDNFYSLPVESNYASDINQTNISKNVKRLYVLVSHKTAEELLQ